MAEILPILRKILSNQSINQSLIVYDVNLIKTPLTLYKQSGKPTQQKLKCHIKLILFVLVHRLVLFYNDILVKLASLLKRQKYMSSSLIPNVSC